MSGCARNLRKEYAALVAGQAVLTAEIRKGLLFAIFLRRRHRFCHLRRVARSFHMDGFSNLPSPTSEVPVTRPETPNAALPRVVYAML